MKYSTLNRCHPSLDLDDVHKRDVLFRGVDVQDQAHKFLKPEPNETDERYRNRCSTTAYDNHFGHIVGTYTSALFSKDLVLAPVEGLDAVDTGYYDQLERNVTDSSSANAVSTTDLAKQTLETALVQQRAYVGVDFPNPADAFSGAPPSTLLEEDAAGTRRAYAFPIPIDCLINWQRDPRTGDLVWAIIKNINDFQPDPFTDRGTYTVQFKVWRKLPSGQVTWQLWETAPIDEGKEPKDTDDLRLAGQGDTSFDRVPIIELCLPGPLAIGGALAPMAVEAFSLKSNLFAAEKKNLFPITYVKLGPEIGAQGGPLPSDVQSDPDRGGFAVAQFGGTLSQADAEVANRLSRQPSHAFDARAAWQDQGFPILGANDDIVTAEPTGDSYRLIYDQLQDRVTAMYQIGHQMAQTLPAVESGMARSAMSKQEDRNASIVVLQALDKHIKRWVLALYDCISKARGEQVSWQCEGLNTVHGSVDVDQVLKTFDTLALTDVPSVTFKRLLHQQGAKQLIADATAEQLQAIDAEIDAASYTTIAPTTLSPSGSL